MKYTDQIDILCTLPRSNYFGFENVKCYTKEVNAYTCPGQNPIIAHPPYQQWSRLRNRAIIDYKEKELAIYCLELVNNIGGIFEHPAGSAIWKEKLFTNGTIISINQHWFGHKARKLTYLYFVNCTPIAHPLNFDAITRTVPQLGRRKREETPEPLCKWLIDCIRQTYKPGQIIT